MEANPSKNIMVLVNQKNNYNKGKSDEEIDYQKTMSSFLVKANAHRQLKIETLKKEKQKELIGILLGIRGYVKSLEESSDGEFCFIDIIDESTIKNFRIIVYKDVISYRDIIKVGIGSFLELRGEIWENRNEKEILIKIENKNGHYIKILENPNQANNQLSTLNTTTKEEKLEPINGYNTLSPRDPVLNTEGNELVEVHNISNSIKGGALVLSEFSYVFMLLISILIGFIFTSFHKNVLYYSKSSDKQWNPSSDPLIFIHISDIHIEFYKDKEQYEELFQIAKNLNGAFYIITGDLGDHYIEENFPRIGKQSYKDWKIYKNLLDKYLSDKKIIDIAGNHDMFGVISPLDEKFGFLDVSQSFKRINTKNIEEFWVKTVKIEGMNFILVNPYNFPVVHPPYGFFPHTTIKLIELLEKEIEKVGPCNIVIHYPIDFFWFRNPAKKNSFNKIMRNKNIQYIFSGHSHPQKFEVRHHEYGGLEFIGTSTKGTSTFGIVTIDNERLVYNQVHYEKNNFTKYFMIHPLPKNQISDKQIFNEKNTEIRIISYDDNINNNLEVSGDFSGKMEYKRTLGNGAKLYSMPLNVDKDGLYEIEVKGPNCYIKREFYIGSKYKLGLEKALLSKAFYRLLYIASLIFLASLIISVFPLRILDLSYIDEWILGLIKKNNYWFYVIILSPLILNYRINTNIPLYFRIILFFFLIYALVCPFHYVEPIDGYVGFTFFCFIFIKDNIYFDEWSGYFIIFFCAGILYPSALVISSFKFQSSKVFYFNFIFLYIAFIGICIVNFRFAGESLRIILLIFHQNFIIIPIVLNILIYYTLCKKYNENKKTNNDKIFFK